MEAGRVTEDCQPSEYTSEMKKRTAKIFLFIIIGLFSTVQTSFASDIDKTYWGIRGNFDINMPGDYKTSIADFDYKVGAGFSLGAVYNIKLVSKFYIEPGVELFYDNYKMDPITYNLGQGEIGYIENPKIDKFGLRIPINLGYQFDIDNNIALSIFTGPEFSIGLSAKAKSVAFESTGLNTNLYNDNNVLGADGAWHRFAASWNIGAQITLNRHYVIGINGNIGITDLVESSEVSFKENSLRLRLGYNF